MDAIRIKGLRSLIDTEKIELKPITVLVGKNSSGKSTFLRSFPLLKQSNEKDIADPILWFGNYVDFGSYQASVSHFDNCDKGNIQYSFLYRLNFDESNKNMNYESALILDKFFYNLKEVQFDIFVNNKIVEKLLINIGKSKISVKFKTSNGKNLVENISIDGICLQIDYKNICWLKKYGMIPFLGQHYIRPGKQNKNIQSMLDSVLSMGGDLNNFIFVDFRFGNGMFNIFLEKIENILNNYFTGENAEINDSQKKIISKYIMNFDYLSNDFDELQRYLIEYEKKMRKEFKIQIKGSDLKELYSSLIAMRLNSIIYFCNYMLQSDMNDVKYIKPIRFDVQRYYRIQGLNVREIDSSGENIPMFLHSLSEQERNDFQEWTKKYFNITFSIKESEGHVSLNIQNDSILDNTSLNLADVGYGYSQVLPILIWLWTCKKELPKLGIYNNRIITLVIEQPEVHLHPAFQAKIIDLFADVINDSKVDSRGRDLYKLRIIFETHSETMVNRLGYLISKKKLDADLVNVLIFNKDFDHVTKITPTKFSNDGSLNNWPIGFFTPERLKNDY